MRGLRRFGPVGRVALAWAAVALITAPAARAQDLVADLSSHLVAITTGFTGTDVLLFGATEGDGDVVVVVRGPDRRAIVRRKERVAGIWVNGAALSYPTVPAFYAVASSKPLAEVIPAAAMKRHGIGVKNLVLAPEKTANTKTATAFRAALLRTTARAGLYGEKTGRVTFLGKRLFRTSIHFPANVPIGNYTVQVFLVRFGRVVEAQTTPLLITKVGVGAQLFQFAHTYPALYGIMAIIIALAAGWIAGVVFRRR
jgi:uncharacterized protein (TIGR02186 family)